MKRLQKIILITLALCIIAIPFLVSFYKRTHFHHAKINSIEKAAVDTMSFDSSFIDVLKDSGYPIRNLTAFNMWNSDSIFAIEVQFSVLIAGVVMLIIAHFINMNYKTAK